ncbi:MAG: dihydrodipicolinate synthase family protein [Planctomycetia bacterium]|nr:dihydrodipicolinate synthase family protein [Planctomycetia bacterium]
MASHGSPLSGILVPHMVPLDDRGRINEEELARYACWLVDRGVHGLYPNGSTGEFTRFTVEERRRIVSIVCEAAAGRVPVVAGAAEANVAETIHACEHALEAGARAVAIVAPFYFKLSAESVYAYFREIARESPIDVTLYNIPMLASPIDVATVRRLAEECPRVIGIKDSSGDISNMQRLIAAVRPVRPEFAFFTGWDAALVAMLLAGCDGGVHATAGVVPEVTRAIYDDVQAGRLDAAFARQRQITDLLDIAFLGDDFPEGFRIAAGVRGFAMGESRQPATDAQRADRQRLAERIRAAIERCGIPV